MGTCFTDIRTKFENKDHSSQYLSVETERSNWLKIIFKKNIKIDHPVYFSVEDTNEVDHNYALFLNKLVKCYDSKCKKVLIIFEGGEYTSLHFVNRISSLKDFDRSISYEIYVKDGYFKNIFSFTKFDISKLKILGGQFGEFSIKYGVCNELSLLGGSFNSIKIGSEARGFLNFMIYDWMYYNLLLRVINIENIEVLDGLQFYNLIVAKSVSIFSKNNINYFGIFYSHIANLSLSPPGRVNIEESTIHQMTAYVGLSSTINYSFTSTEFYVLALKGDLNSSSVLKINSCLFIILKFEKLLNFGQLTIDNILPSNNYKHFIENEAFLNYCFSNQISDIKEFIEISQKIEPNVIEFDQHLKLKLNVETLGECIINEKTKNTKVNFYKSSLNSTTIIDSDLRASSIGFESSNLSKVVFINSNIPPKPYSIFKISNYTDSDMTYNQQITNAYHSSGDYINSSRFNYYYLKSRLVYLVTNFKFRNIPEVLVLISNFLSNKFGTSYFHSVVCLFFFGSLFWFGATSISYEINLLALFSKEYWNIVGINLPYVLRFILPTFSNEIISDFYKDVFSIDNLRATFPAHYRWVEFLMVVWRIFSGYFVYQFIVAFRRYGKINK